ncbi:MAG: dephospho-CoA kinase [Bacteroidales bacterium]|nr:dephospho-CoA kinase [Bacteroidales bacterium]
MNDKKLIAITGGIGCGKSMVSQLLKTMGFAVYDCDANAKQLMLTDKDLMKGLTDLFGKDTYLADGTLNKQHLAASIFGNADALRQMNALVHPTVARDLKAQMLKDKHSIFFFESAILFESHFDRLVSPDITICVSSPLELRIARATARDHSSREQVIGRIESQMPQDEKDRRADYLIINDEKNSVIHQIDKLLNSIS